MINLSFYHCINTIQLIRKGYLRILSSPGGNQHIAEEVVGIAISSHIHHTKHTLEILLLLKSSLPAVQIAYPLASSKLKIIVILLLLWLLTNASTNQSTNQPKHTLHSSHHLSVHLSLLGTVTDTHRQQHVDVAHLDMGYSHSSPTCCIREVPSSFSLHSLHTEIAFMLSSLTSTSKQPHFTTHP